MKNKFEQSKLVKDLVGDPSEPPDVVRFQGHLGQASQPGSIRIYEDESDLRSFIEVSEADVVKTRPVAPDSDAMAVWVGGDANVRLVEVARARDLSTPVMPGRTRKRLSLSMETLRNLVMDDGLTDDRMRRLPLPVTSTVGMCTSCNTCNLTPCRGSRGPLC